MYFAFRNNLLTYMPYVSHMMLPNAPAGFGTMQDTNKVLAISRIMVAWQPLGLAMGTYDMCNRYLQQRQQFGSPLAAFQVIIIIE